MFAEICNMLYKNKVILKEIIRKSLDDRYEQRKAEKVTLNRKRWFATRFYRMFGRSAERCRDHVLRRLKHLLRDAA